MVVKPYGRRWRKLRKFCLNRDGGRCTRCGSTQKLEAHHVVPISAGGADVPSNVRILCLECHSQLHGH